MDMNVLVTGGAGYIGSHAVRLLRERGYGAVVLDSLEFGHRAAIGNTPLIEGNIQDLQLLDRIFAEHAIDAVMHFAAYKAVAESMTNPLRYFTNNVYGTLMLLDAMQRAGMRQLVFSSTAAVYGTPAALPISEASELRPENPYGESKRMVEQMLKWYDVCHGLRSVSLRYFNVAGAAEDASIGEDPARALNLVPVVMKAALGHIPTVDVYGTDYPTPDGTAIRDYIHVVDLANAHIKALEYLQHHDRSAIFNLGTGQGISVQEVINMARDVSGVDIPVNYADRRPGDPAAIWADSTAAQTQLDWRPEHNLESMVRSAWRWHTSHPHGYAEPALDSQ